MSEPNQAIFELNMARPALVSLLALKAATGFVPTKPMKRAFSLFAENSEAFPFLNRPEKLDGLSVSFMSTRILILVGTMIGDVGFDPLRLAEVQVDLSYARGAEIKHGRIAMLAGKPCLRIQLRVIQVMSPCFASGNCRIPRTRICSPSWRGLPKFATAHMP